MTFRVLPANSAGDRTKDENLIKMEKIKIINVHRDDDDKGRKTVPVVNFAYSAH